MCFHEVYGSLMYTCFNVFCTNAIYIHIHYGEYTNMYIMFKWCQNIFVKKIEKKEKNKPSIFFMACYDKNVIFDSTIQEKKLYDDMACYSMSC